MLRQMFSKSTKNILRDYEIHDYKPATYFFGASGYALLKFDIVLWGIKIGGFTSITHRELSALKESSKEWDLWIKNKSNIRSDLTTNPIYRFS